MEGTVLRAEPAVALAPGLGRVLRGVALAAAAVTLAGALLAPERVWAGVLLSAIYVLGLGLGGVVFLAFTHVTRGMWARPIRPLAAALASTLPLGAALLLVALAGTPWLYEWSSSPLPGAKGTWLSPIPFLVRAALCLAVWIAFGRRITALSVAGDREGPALRTSCVFLVLFAATFSVASFDWIMSREAHWFSTVFAVYTFTGLFVAGLAAITAVGIRLRRRDPASHGVGDDQLHDLGKLLLGFTTFWAYIWFCQHMLIWYAHIPEETAYYVRRFEGAWGPLMVLNLAVNWLIPFLVLLPRPAKRRESTMLGIALLLLGGHALDLFLLIQPADPTHGPAAGVWEVAPFLGALAVFALALDRALRAAPPTGVRDGNP